MKVRLTFKAYVDALREYSNFALDISTILRPFGILEMSEPASDLMIGHLLDAMQEEFDEDESVDALDVASVALSLGYDAAEGFLDRGPLIIWQALEASRFTT